MIFNQFKNNIQWVKSLATVIQCRIAKRTSKFSKKNPFMAAIWMLQFIPRLTRRVKKI